MQLLRLAGAQRQLRKGGGSLDYTQRNDRWYECVCDSDAFFFSPFWTKQPVDSHLFVLYKMPRGAISLRAGLFAHRGVLGSLYQTVADPSPAEAQPWCRLVHAGYRWAF